MEKILQYPINKIFEIPILAVSMPEVLELVDYSITNKKRLDIGVVNAAKVVNMQRNAELKEAVLSSDVIFADGVAVVWASRMLGKPLPERIAGIDLMWEIFKIGNEKHYRVFCFGATEEVNAKVADILQEIFPNLVLAGRRNGYYGINEEENIAKQIAESKADILFVAMTSPKKENFMAKWGDMMGVYIIHGVGGSFDVMSGKVRRAPVVWQKVGMEWLYRVIQEPRRMWKRYAITNSLFIWMLLKEFLKRPFRKK